ncbi:MAG TPA: oligoendopeptidase F [Anaerolineaceae bacterium]|nr:oligoendopeptidase F [Anaerolineaceae bacterium]
MESNRVIKRSEVPVEQTWNLEKIFPSVQAWEDALNNIDDQISEIDVYKNTLAQSPQQLVDCLKKAEVVSRKVEKIYIYASLESSVDNSDQAALARSVQARGKYAKLHATTAFIEPELIGIGFPTLANWCKENEALMLYQTYFKQLERKQSKVRSFEVENVIALASEPLGVFAQTYNSLTNVDIRFDPAEDQSGNTFPVEQGNYGALISHEDRHVRKTAWQNYSDGYSKYKNTLAGLQIGGLQRDILYANVRGFNNSLEASLFPNNIPEEVFHNLISVFRNHLPTWHKYWRIRKQWLGLDEFQVYDIKAPLTDQKPVISYEQAVEWITEGMKPLGKEYVGILNKGATSDRWVDWAVNQGKRQGAFSSGVYDTSPFIMMSYNNDVFSLSTLAHELGHSMHSYYTKHTQPYIHGRYALFVAEVASNFNQAMVRDYLLSTQTNPIFQLALIEEAMSNFHRYFFIMPTLAQWELDMHQRLEQGKAMNAKVMIDRCAELFLEGYGDKVVFDHDRIGITWSQFSHMYMNYYVYQYATGISGAHALVENILVGQPGAVDRYLTFLSAGNSVYPLEALHTAGVDLTSSEPVEKAFNYLGSIVDRLERLLAGK